MGCLLPWEARQAQRHHQRRQKVMPGSRRGRRRPIALGSGYPCASNSGLTSGPKVGKRAPHIPRDQASLPQARRCSQHRSARFEFRRADDLQSAYNDQLSQRSGGALLCPSCSRTRRWSVLGNDTIHRRPAPLMTAYPKSRGRGSSRVLRFAFRRAPQFVLRRSRPAPNRVRPERPLST